jgi:protein phosphatase PTC7
LTGGPRLVTAVAGFPKDLNLGSLRRGQFGDDSYFVVRHKLGDVIGVADGVGGWRQYGVDPGEFSGSLMRAAERLVARGKVDPTSPQNLLKEAFEELRESKSHVIGSSTACVVSLDKKKAQLHTANIGDSGFLVVRNGALVHRSEEQQHYFNTPFQLSVAPPGSQANILSDSPESADSTAIKVKEGDVILVGTDGVFDNLPDSWLVPQLSTLHSVFDDPAAVQKVADMIAAHARKLAFDPAYLSPFARNARSNGIDALGGKPDDITILLATVCF